MRRTPVLLQLHGNGLSVAPLLDLVYSNKAREANEDTPPQEVSVPVCVFSPPCIHVRVADRNRDARGLASDVCRVPRGADRGLGEQTLFL